MNSNVSTERQQAPLVFVVDDLWPNVKIVTRMLEKAGFRSDYCQSGEEALQQIPEKQPDLILLDIMMPGMDGFEVCKKLKENPDTRETPIIFLTAKASDEDIVHGFESGAVDYVTKPFKSTELKARVRTHIELKNTNEKLQRSYQQLKASQSRIIELERKNSVLAMVATANHELNQPLTVLKVNFDLLKMSLRKSTLSEEQINYIKKISNSIDDVQKRLQKFRESLNFRIEKYSENTDMVVFDEKKDH